MTETPVLAVEGLSRWFGALPAVHGVRLALRPGEVRGIIGPNGAGKSTLLRLIAGELRPTSGRVLFRGEEITGWPMHRVARRGIVKSFQITQVFPNLTCLENVRIVTQGPARSWNFWQDARGDRRALHRAEELLARVGLWAQRDLPAYALSHGAQRHLEVAMALAAQPQVLLLDEPTAGMSAEEIRSTMELLRAIGQERTLVIVEHRMPVIMGLCERITVLHFGRVLAEGTPAEIQASEEVQAVYLGRPPS
ncbi:MAG: ABC transporter ATP-binding protein [Armatimonadota bacterium]|nr:ABC transporter ATP-binding protein [Armatimonadota bacterium]MDR7485743.1 ABC transporter ATP-binding protein [Armatimonadota bacterium]MDR7537578.1 ABC transporter ATP-binding protein [Armatimonadota bacterium]